MPASGAQVLHIMRVLKEHPPERGEGAKMLAGFVSISIAIAIGACSISLSIGVGAWQIASALKERKPEA